MWTSGRTLIVGAAGLVAGALLVAIPMGVALSSEISKAADLQRKVDSAESSARYTQSRQDQLVARESRVERVEDDLAEREAAVSAVESKIEGRTIPGDGVFEVGVDIKAGTYKAPASPDCYWSVNGDPNGDDIINNANPDGQFIVEVSNGQYLELARCAPLVRQ